MDELQQQMEMFEDGGLADQGGTVDPVSGNDVPTGSLQEEVRDDIPAQLSEGEYVVPADVVRFYGIRFFEELRMKAKEGYGLLEAKGQMGNGDEQVIPDDVGPQETSSPSSGKIPAASKENAGPDDIVKMVKEKIGADSIKFKGQTYTAEQIASRIKDNM